MTEARPSSRREFLAASAAAAAFGGLDLRSGQLRGTHAHSSPLRRAPTEFDDRELRVGLIGCGGRGIGAARNALATAGKVKLVAVGDAFEDSLSNGLKALAHPESGVSEKVGVPDSQRFVGFDAFRRVVDCELDVVILATPPHFRPAQFAYAVEKGRHCFIEKPVAVDGAGVRTVLAAAELADQKKLCVGVGLQRHHQTGYIETMKRIHGGEIGDVVAARCYWNQGLLWHKDRRPEWSDMEWQLRNWLYFTWLSGDHIVEQHIHNLDVINWAKRAHPVRAMGMGGRQVRTDAKYGHIFDHHDVHYEFADGSFMFSQCRQIDGCANQVSEHVVGTKGRADLNTGGWTILGEKPWQFPRGEANEPYQGEHDDFFAAIRSGQIYNEARYGAESTLTAVMGRMATYSGRVVTWDEAMASERLGPDSYEWGDLPVPPVPVPGRD
jgi:myo-inositol 2-dehydrogenase/D-chiro-inositol 1-dehydrogenase